MKQPYEAPALEIERFVFTDVITNSPGEITPGDGEIDPWND